LRPEEEGDLHLRGNHVAFEILYVVRKIKLLSLEMGRLSIKKWRQYVTQFNR